MPKYEPSELKKLDVIVLRDAKNNEIHKVIFPNGLQAGTGDVGFNSGIVIPDSAEAPKNTSNSLYAVNGTLYYAGSALGGAGTSLTVEEVDGNPSVSSVTKIKVTNGTLTDDGSGTVTITTGGGGGGGAPSDAQYVVLTTDGDLSAERVLAVGDGLDTTDAGAGGNITISLDLTEVIASDGANRVLTSDGDGTLTAEANITYDGTTISLDDAVTVNDSGGDNDFRVESQGEDEALFVDADANALYINKGETAFETHIASTNDVALSVTAAGIVLNEDGHATNDFRVESDSEDEALFVDASENKLHINKGETAFETHIANTNDVAVSVTAAGVVFNEDGHATNDFRVETDNSPYALFVDAGNDQVLILSGGSDGWDGSGVDHSQAADVAFFVSGTMGSRGTGTKGASLFGGDVIVSGSLSINRSDNASEFNMVTITTDGKVGIGTDAPGNKLSVGGNMDLGEYLYHKNDEDTYIRFTDDDINIQAGGVNFIDITQGGTNEITFNEAGADVNFRVEGDNDTHLLFVDAGNDSIYIGADASAGADNNFFVSGSIGSRGGATRGVSLFGGDVAVSGSLFVGQLDVGSVEEPVLVVDQENKRVGIGTSSPTYGLDVSRYDSTAYNASTDYSTGDGHIRVSNIYGTVGTSAGIIFANSSDAATSGLLSTIDPEQSSGADVVKVVLDAHRNDAVVIRGKRNTRTHNQVLILSGGSDGWDGTGIDRFQAADVAFYVSGSIGSIGTADRGTSVFGGDVQITGSLYVSDLGVGRDVVFYGEDADAIGMVWDADSTEHGALILGQNDHGVDFTAYGETSGASLKWDQSLDKLRINKASLAMEETSGRHATEMKQEAETLNITHVNVLTTKPMEVKFHGLVKDHQDAKILAAIDAQSVLANEIF